jgi:hypothetical protein
LEIMLAVVLLLSVLFSLPPSSFILFLQTGQEGLEPPTDGFGDRYSTN